MTSAEQSMAFFMLICAVPIAGVATYAFQNRAQPGARGFLLCGIGMVGWSVQLALVTWPTQIVPVFVNTTIRHAFQFLVIFGWPLFVGEYTRRGTIAPKRSHLAALLVLPALTILLTATNPWHHLVLASETPSNPAGISEFVLGPWYLAHIGFAVTLIILPAGVLARDLRSAVGDHRNQLLLLLGGWSIGFPGALNTHLFRNVDAIPSYVDLTPFLFLVTTALWGLALFRYRLFGLVPVSRRKAIETMSDAVISVDTGGRIVDANPAARQLFERDDYVGDDLESFCRGHTTILERYERGRSRGTELSIETNGQTKHFSMDIRPIEQGTSVTGTLLVLRDITTLKEREQELDLVKQVLSRAFRHNIRNELTTLRGHTAMIQERTDDERIAEHLGEIMADTDRLLGHSEKAKDLETIIDAETTREPIRIGQTVAQYARQYTERYPDLEVTNRVPVDLTVVGHPSLDMVIEELVQNAIFHQDDADTPIRVAVRTRTTDGSVSLVIADNGPGIDPHEIETIRAGEETDLQHGSGIGLWMIDLIVRKSGGSLAIDTDPELGGARVQIRLSRAR